MRNRKEHPYRPRISTNPSMEDEVIQLMKRVPLGVTADHGEPTEDDMGYPLNSTFSQPMGVTADDDNYRRAASQSAGDINDFNGGGMDVVIGESWFLGEAANHTSGN